MIKYFTLIVIAFLFSSCYMTLRIPQIRGSITQNILGKKVGVAYAHSFLGLVGLGDASYETACKRAGISSVSHVDVKSKNILGLYAKHTVYVYGE